jgi:hypothetical protein
VELSQSTGVNDPLRRVTADEVVFVGAINTFDANRESEVDDVLKLYLKHLEEQAAKLEHSQPGLDPLRAGLAERPANQ